MKYLLNRRSFISLMILFSFFDNFGMKIGIDDYLFKVVFVGDAGVGKTQIINKYGKDIFNNDYNLIMGIEFAAKEVKIDYKKIKLQLWDTAGQEKFRSIIKPYCKIAHLIVFVYAIDNKNSFNNIQSWVNDVKAETDEKKKFLLVGNKCDLEDKRQVSREEAEKYAKDKGMKFFEVSAKDGTNIDDMFKSSIQELLEDMEKEEISYYNKYNNTNNSEQKDLLDDKDIYDIKNKKNFCWMEYCFCCPCWEKTEGNGEEEEEVENDE